jgi:hypothetical protein
MSRYLVFFFAVFGFSIPGYSQVLNTVCHANVECKGLFNDLFTDKFVLKYPADKWEVFVHADTYELGDKRATSHAIAGMVPLSKEKFGYFPQHTSSHLSTTPRLSSAYDKQDVERKTIRRAIERLMKMCDETKDCALD